MVEKVLLDREVEIEGRLLEDDPHLPQALEHPLADVHPKDADRAFGLRIKPRGQREQCRLSGAVKPEQLSEIAWSDRERDVFQNPPRPEPVSEPLDRQRGQSGHRRSSCSLFPRTLECSMLHCFAQRKGLPDDQEHFAVDPQGGPVTRRIRQALARGACSSSACGAGPAPLCAVAYCRRTHPARHSIDRCRRRWYRRNLVRRSGGHGAHKRHPRGQGAARRWRSVHRPDQKLHHRREGDHPTGVAMKEHALRYLSGFGNEHATEAVAGALPAGQNAPQRPPLGLYTEQISGTPFTAARAENRRSWLYRIRPSAMHPPFKRIDNRLLATAPLTGVEAPPNRLRWNPLPIPERPTDFVEGLVTMAANGSASGRTGIGIHVYLANRSMTDRYFWNADGEMLVVPQEGCLRLHTELGVIDAAPGEIAVVQ